MALGVATGIGFLLLSMFRDGWLLAPKGRMVFAAVLVSSLSLLVLRSMEDLEHEGPSPVFAASIVLLGLLALRLGPVRANDGR